MTPDFAISADGIGITGGIKGNLAGLRLTDKPGLEADQVEISITSPNGRFALPRRGAVLRVALGWEGRGLVDKGAFVVDEVGEDGPPDVVVIVARGADFRDSLKASREASYNDTTLGGILETVAARNGLIPAIHPDLARVAIPHLSQTGESDANMVTRLGDDYGAVATIKSGRLLFVPWGRGLTASGSMLPGLTISRKQGDRHSFRAADRDGTQTGVQAKWTDPASGRINFALAGAAGNVQTLKKSYANQDEARAAAEAAWARKSSKAHTWNHTLAIGDASITAATPLTLTGWRREITGISWLTGTVTHDMTDSGYVTSYDASELVGGEKGD